MLFKAVSFLHSGMPDGSGLLNLNINVNIFVTCCLYIAANLTRFIKRKEKKYLLLMLNNDKTTKPSLQTELLAHLGHFASSIHFPKKRNRYNLLKHCMSSLRDVTMMLHTARYLIF